MNLIQRFFFSLLLVSSSFTAQTIEIREGVLRTPDDRFEDLEDFPYEPNYIVIDNLRIHYLDEGPKNAEPIVLFHGEPTWSYLFRKMIPVFKDAGYRVVVPDMVGFGRSDKFESKSNYSYEPVSYTHLRAHETRRKIE